MTTRASWTRRTPFGSTYSTPPACPSPAVSTRITLQPVRRSRFPVASAAGTQRRHGIRRAARDERIAVVARDTDQILEARIVRRQLVVGHGPVGQGAIRGQEMGHPALAHGGEC